MSVVRDALVQRAWGCPPGGVAIGGAGLASLHCRLLASWAVVPESRVLAASPLTTFTAFRWAVCEKCVRGAPRPQPTFFRTSSDEAGEGGKRGNQPFRFAPNSRRSQSIFRFPKAALHSAVSNYTSGYNAEIADLDLLSASSSHKLLYLSRCSWDARAKVLGSRRGNQIHVFDPDAVIL